MKFCKKKIKLFASCILVNGANRSIICDLQRNSFAIIPNDLYNVFVSNDGKSLFEIKFFYDNQYDTIIDDYYKFLLENEYIFLTEYPHLFPKMSLDWYESSLVNNAIIDAISEFNFEIIFTQLASLNCKSIEIRFFKIININFIQEILNYLEKTKSIITSIGFIVNSSNVTNDTILDNLIRKYPRISYFIVGNHVVNKFIEPLRQEMGYVYYTIENILSLTQCGLISKKSFAINTKLFTESQQHNTCLNRKISIDKDGFIRNCPSMPQHFGNIKDTTLEEALNHPDFKKYWNINKDMIAVCKDCEFRHICTDCRAYTERTHFEEDIDLSKPLKCGYNPYTNEWAEWSTNPLKEKAIEYYGMQDLVKKND